MIIEGVYARDPERFAHVSGASRLTYRELDARSDRLSATLRDDRRPVAVIGRKEPGMLVAFLAATKAGRPYVPIDSDWPPLRRQRVIELSGASTVLRAADLPEGVDPLPPVPVSSDDLAYILFTSGTTGDPKGVQITHGNLNSFVSWMLEEQKFSGGQVFLNQAPFTFDLSVMDLYCSLATGSTVWSLDPRDAADPGRLFATLPSSGITVWVSTPSFARLCLSEPSFNQDMLPHVRKFLFCGETLPTETASQLLHRFADAEVWNLYGPTEATVATTSVRITPELLDRYPELPVGCPKPGTDIAVVGDDGRPAADRRGEIVIKGPNVSPGYIGSPPFGGAYPTGDIGSWREGLLFCHGRRDSQVKLHGYRIELGDVEANLRQVPWVADAVALVVGERLTACVVPGAGTPQGDDFTRGQALRAELARRLPAHMVPRRFRFLPALPLTANGKADRRRLAAELAS